MELYFYSSHILSFAWSVLCYMSLCLFCFLACHNYLCWTHLFERAKMMLWFVRIPLCASLNFFELWNCSSASLISFWAWRALLFFEEMLSCFTYIYLRVSKIFKKFSLASLKLIWEKEILCSWSSLIFVWACQKQHMKVSPKVVDIQEGYNKNCHEDHWTK